MHTAYFKNLFFATLLFLMPSAEILAQEMLTVVDTLFDRAAHEEDFAFGADISWLSQQESWGTYYCNHAGTRTDLMKILQEEQGINAVRFRVWVNPSGGWSGKNDVVGLCRRAHARNMKIMIAFHYSDTWADSGSQTIPVQWTDHSADALAQNVYNHTYDVLKALKDEGIVPNWVGIGNETKYGMLYDVGRTKTTDGYKNFVKFINSAYQAIQDVDPSMKAIIHLSNGHDFATANSMFSNLKKYGAKYDIIGLSAYPRWSHLDVTTDATIRSTVNTYMNVFKSLKSTFGKPVMVVETGHYCEEPLDGNRFLAEFMKALIDDGELGCFYWEPEAFENSGYNLGAWSSKNHQATIAMDAFKGWKHTEVSSYMTMNVLQAPSDTVLTSVSGDTVSLKVYVKSATSSNRITGVDFFLNGQRAHTETAPETGNTYVYNTDSLPAGVCRFYAVARDNQSHVQSTDTMSFLVGTATLFQENTTGIAGMSEELSVSNTMSHYSYDGYISGDAKINQYIRWGLRVPEPGEYTIAFRYCTQKKNGAKLVADKTNSAKVLTFPVTATDKWAFAEKKLSFEYAGEQTISLQAMNWDGLPSVDYMAVVSPDSVAAVEMYDLTSLIPLQTEILPTNDNTIYDITGRKVPADNSSLAKGLYIQNGKKIFIP